MAIRRIDGRENIVVVEQKVRVPDDLPGENDGSALLSFSSKGRLGSPRMVITLSTLERVHP